MTSARKTPSRGFPEAEYNHLLERAQDYLNSQSLDALLLTTEVDIRYFTGFLSQYFFRIRPAPGSSLCRRLASR